MGLTCQDIAIRLGAMIDFIATLEHQHLLTETLGFQTLKQSLTQFNLRNLNPDTITEDELEQFEKICCLPTILDHLDSSASRYHLPWNRPQPASYPAINTISWLHHQCESFIQPWIEELEKLKQSKEKRTKKQLAHKIIDSDNPDNPLEASNPLLSLQLQKLRLIYIEITQIHDGLCRKQERFKKASSASLANVKLVQWQTQYRRDTERACDRINQANRSLTMPPFDDRSFKEQGQLVSSSIESISHLNRSRDHLAAQIDAEEQLAFPDYQQNELLLIDLQQQAYIALKKAIQTFLHYLIEINPKSKHSEFQYFTQTLTQFVRLLIQDLAEGPLPIANKAAMNTLKRGLAAYIDMDTFRFYSAYQSKQPSDFVSHLMTQLTPTLPSAKLKSEHKMRLIENQIEKIYAIRAKLQERHLETSALYFQFYHAISQTRALIHEKRAFNQTLVAQLQTKIAGFIQGLKQRYSLIPFNCPLYQKAHAHVNELIILQTRLSEQCLLDIEQANFSIENFTRLHAFLKRFENATLNADLPQITEKITRFQASIEVKMKRQEAIDAFLKEIECNLQDTLKIQQTLDDFYNRETLQLQNILTTKINQTGLAMQSLGWDDLLINQTLKPQINLSLEIMSNHLSFMRNQIQVELELTHLDAMIAEVNEKKQLLNTLQVKITQTRSLLVLAKWRNGEINHALKPQINLSKNLASKNHTLAQIQDKVADALTMLDARINKIKSSFRQDIVSQQKAIDLRLSNLTEAIGELHYYHILDIPFFRGLKHAMSQVKQAHHDYQDHIQALEHTTGDSLHAWHTTYSEKQNTIQINADSCGQLLADAKPIEQEIARRFSSEPYQIAMSMLNELKKEFNRIFEKHLKDANQLSIAQKEALRNIQSSLLSQTHHTSEIKEALNYIDPRLLKLKTIYAQFKAINDEYTHNNYNPSATTHDNQLLDNFYIRRLQQQANQSLRSNNMIGMSDGVRSRFIQWIRQHIVKPLQQVRQHNPYVFFPTTWACKTEKTLVKLGNEVHQQLTRSLQ